MNHKGHHQKPEGLHQLGITNAEQVNWNFVTSELYAEALKREEGELAHMGPLVVDTGRYTGRSPKDKFIVRDDASEEHVDWGEVNKPMEPAHFAKIKEAILEHTAGMTLYVQDVFVGAHPDYRVPVRVITEYAWHSLFTRDMFIRPTAKTRDEHDPVYTVIDLPSFKADPETMGTRTETVVAMNLSEKLVLVGSTEYAGEIKKSVFSMMNYELPFKGVMPMHCSANVGPDNDVALFFGLSGTGKTTLSATADRTLVGDDEHGWSDQGVFNFEGGCYAKIINLSAQAEPEIYEATRRFGTILENVVLDDETRRPVLSDASKTENMRAAYPITHISNASRVGYAGQPTDVVFLTADAFGVLPPISKLTYDQAMYYFLSGYTAKLAGTERGVTEPQATFSACFGAPFMPLRPFVYADLLVKEMKRHNVKAWLVNTGWTGGPYGVGKRMEIAHTRAMLRAALERRLDDVQTTDDNAFGLCIPLSCPDVPANVLDPYQTWDDKGAYDEQARKVAAMFEKNFEQFAADVPESVRKSGPRSEEVAS
ncbi:MAG: phosphoenolpyruvate carboxykinase [Trueperaceae bacterium]|nr:phosphoenolpyruvate carboxykinase [Trueperaceae bacterium]